MFWWLSSALSNMCLYRVYSIKLIFVKLMFAVSFLLSSAVSLTPNYLSIPVPPPRALFLPSILSSPVTVCQSLSLSIFPNTVCQSLSSHVSLFLPPFLYYHMSASLSFCLPLRLSLFPPPATLALLLYFSFSLPLFFFSSVTVSASLSPPNSSSNQTHAEHWPTGGVGLWASVGNFHANKLLFTRSLPAKCLAPVNQSKAMLSLWLLWLLPSNHLIFHYVLFHHTLSQTD